MSDQNKLNRREFMKDAAIAGAGLAAVGALGACSPTPAPATPVPATAVPATTTPVRATTVPATAVPATAVPATAVPTKAPAPVVPGLPAKWDKETDVIVVGTGFGGLPAAIEAKRAGADVIILEKNDWVGGLSIMAGGANFYCNTHVQKAAAIEDRVEWGIADEMMVTEYRGEPEIIKAYVERGEDTLSWYEKLGIAWSPTLTDGYGTGVLRNHRAMASPTGAYPGGLPATGGISQISVCLKELNRLGVPILQSHRMKRVYRPDSGGPVVGVQVETPQGMVNIKARKAIVLATGGTTGNEQMVKDWDSRYVGESFYPDGEPYCKTMGDGIVAGVAIGAALSNMSFVSFLPLNWGTHQYQWWDPKDPKAIPMNVTAVPLSGTGYQRVILVANGGQRYVDETLGATYNASYPDGLASPGVPGIKPSSRFLPPFFALPEPKNVWAITDAAGAKELKWPEANMRNPQPQVSTNSCHPDSVAVADTLQALAGKMKIDPAKLAATVSRYNGFVDAGKDADFGKPMPMFKIGTPPFFAAKLNMVRHTQQGGLRVNSKCQVVAVSDEADAPVAKSVDKQAVIPHLYAIGECAASMGWRRVHRKIGHYTTLSRIAGENAVKETPISGV